MANNYQGYTPKNYKRGMLILGKYRPLDVAILVVCSLGGALIALVAMTISMNVPLFLLGVAVILIGLFLTAPNTNYHNALTLIQLIYNFNFKYSKFYSKEVAINKPTEEKKKKIKKKKRRSKDNEQD